MPRLTARRGAGLAEMIVALTLSAFAAAAVATALAGSERYMRRVRAAADARRNVREAASALAWDLEAALGDSIRVRGDTAVDYLGLVGTSVVCVSAGDVLVLAPDAAANGLPFSSWRESPEAGDAVSLFDTAGAGAWRTALVDSASSRADGAGCRPSSGLISPGDSVARRPVMRLVLRTPLEAPAAVGAPVRVLRDGRYALTHSGDGSWLLSYRRCAPSSCGVAQPVAGPFAQPADSGLTFANFVGESRLEVSMRAPTGKLRAPPWAERFSLAIRNRASEAP